VNEQQFIESPSVGVCLAELQSLEYGEVRAQYRLRVAQCLVVAVDNASDAIEITDEYHHTQVRSRPLRSSCAVHTASGATAQRKAPSGPVTRVGPTGAGPQQKSPGPRQK